MPQKTKKQKIKSLQHRHGQVENAPSAEKRNSEEKQSAPSIPTFSFSRISQSHQKSTNISVPSDTFIYLRKDLIKTVILAILCCGTLIALSFVLK